MFEAKDTVMKDSTIVTISEKGEFTRGGVGITARVYKNCCLANVSQESINDNIGELLKAQAEISFKAGQQEGRKEMVEWIKSHQLIEPCKNSITRFEPFYQIEQAKLKEWVILWTLTKRRRKMVFDKWFIPGNLLNADNNSRQWVVIVDKKVNLPDIVYQPLYGRLEAKAKTELPPEILRIKVAIYKLDKAESRNRPFNFYAYQGDGVR